MSPSYGKYDDGAAIFTLYSNFAGTTTPTGWTNNGAIQNNGVTISGSSSGNYFITSSTYGINVNQILDIYGKSTGNTNADFNGDFGYISSDDCTGGVIFGLDGYPQPADYARNGACDGTDGSLHPSAGSFHVLTEYWPSLASVKMSFDYGATGTITSHVPSAKLPIGGVVATGSTDTYSIVMEWARLRAYLPNGATPKTTFGTLTAVLAAVPKPYTLTNQTIDIGQISLANTVLSNGISGTASYTGNWLWVPPASSHLAASNTIISTLPASNNALTLTINAVSSTSMKLTYSGTNYFVNTIGTNTIYGTWTFNAFASDANSDLSPTLTNTVTVNPTLTVSTPLASAPSLDNDQPETITGTIPSTGTSPYSYSWQVSVNGAAFATTSQCTTNTGGNQISGNTVTCSIAANQLTATDNYNFELMVTDSATTPVTANSANALVSVSSLLSAPSAPTVSESKLDIGQIETVNGIIPSGGTSPYSYAWLISINGASYVSASECSTSSGSNQISGNTVTCTIPANTLSAGVNYNFELQASDSATTPEVQTSSASNTLTTASQLTVATPMALLNAIDVDQADTLTGTIPSTGTSLYSYSWQMSVNGAAFSTSSKCLPNSAANEIAGNTVTCSIAANQLTATDNYNFELRVTDSATTPVTANSANALVTVSSPLTASSTPIVSANALNAGQTETINSILPSTGTPQYTYTWHISVNGGAFSTATECTQPTGSGQNTGNTVTCTIPGNTLDAGNSYNFALEIADSATAPESAFSATSNTIAVSTQLTAPSAPTVLRPKIEPNQLESINDTIPSSGSAPYSYTWLISTNGQAYSSTTPCTTSSGVGIPAGNTVTCIISPNTLTVGNTYNFELNVTDSANSPSTATSPASTNVIVHSPLTAASTPIPLSAALDSDEVETINSTLPSTGFPPYSYSWFVSVNNGAYAAATECTSNSGGGQAAGNTVTCTIHANTLTAGNTYNFELEINGSATTPEVTTSLPSNTITVASGLSSSSPIVTYPTVDTNNFQVVTISVFGGTPPYTYNFGIYNSTTNALLTSSSPTTSATTNSFTFNPTVPGTYYANIVITDGANSPESTSMASGTFLANLGLQVPTTPTLNKTSLEINQTILITSTVSGGTPPYTYVFTVSDATTGAPVASSGSINTSSTTSAFVYNATSPGEFRVNVTVTETAIPPSPARATNSTKSVVFTVSSNSTSSIPTTPFTGGSLPPATTTQASTTTTTAASSSTVPSTTIPQSINSTYNFTRGETREINVSKTLSVTVTSPSGGSFNITITNVTNSTVPPQPYEPVEAFRISVKPMANLELSLSMGYPCSTPSNELVPYLYNNNDSWTRITNFSVNSSDCKVIVSAHPGLVGLFYSPTVSPSATPTPIARQIPYVTIIIIIAAAIIAYYFLIIKRRLKKKRGGE